MHAAGYAYSRCCVADTWTTDTLVDWPIRPEARYRLVGVDVTNYGDPTTCNFTTLQGRARLRTLLAQAIARGKFLDVMFHDVTAADTAALRATLAILAEHRAHLVTYDSLP